MNHIARGINAESIGLLVRICPDVTVRVEKNIKAACQLRANFAAERGINHVEGDAGAVVKEDFVAVSSRNDAFYLVADPTPAALASARNSSERCS